MEALEALQANDYRKINTLAGENYHPDISKVVKEHLYRGTLQVQALQMFHAAVSAARKGQRENKMTSMLFFLRVGVVLLFSIAGNFFLARILPTVPHTLWVLIFASLLLVTVLCVCPLTLPRHWIWRGKRMTTQGHVWMQALFGGGDNLDAELAAMRRRGIVRGIDTSEQQLSFLRSWTEKQEEEIKHARAKQVDIFPLLELLALGSLSVLHLSPVLLYLLKTLLKSG